MVDIIVSQKKKVRSFMTQVKEAINMSHSHYWKCTDVPGYFLCECGSVSEQDRNTGLKRIWELESEGGEI
jgi:hypothetical protein